MGKTQNDAPKLISVIAIALPQYRYRTRGDALVGARDLHLALLRSYRYFREVYQIGTRIPERRSLSIARFSPHNDQKTQAPRPHKEPKGCQSVLLSPPQPDAGSLIGRLHSRLEAMRRGDDSET